MAAGVPNNIDSIRLLLSHGANPNAITSHDHDTPLHDAVRYGEVTADMVTAFLDHGADLSLEGSWKLTPIEEAREKSTQSRKAFDEALALRSKAQHQTRTVIQPQTAKRENLIKASARSIT